MKYKHLVVQLLVAIALVSGQNLNAVEKNSSILYAKALGASCTASILGLFSLNGFGNAYKGLGKCFSKHVLADDTGYDIERRACSKSEALKRFVQGPCVDFWASCGLLYCAYKLGAYGLKNLDQAITPEEL